MKNLNTFIAAGWDIVGKSTNGSEDIWSICEATNYPRRVRRLTITRTAIGLIAMAFQNATLFLPHLPKDFLLGEAVTASTDTMG